MMALQNFSQSGTIVQNPQTSIENGFMLFGVRVMTDGSFRKCVSLNNLAQYQQSDPSQPGEGEAVAAAGGYRSDDEIHAASAGTRERKRGVPWTEEEHKLFLFGLERVGKGDWRGISRNFVKTRTPTQVASHAQKYFLRRSNLNRRRRRSSLFDITTDTLLCSPGEEPSIQNHQNQSQVMPSLDLSMDCLPVSSPTPMIVDDSEKATIQPNESIEPKVVKPIPVFPSVPLGMVVGLGMPPSPLSAKLSEQHSARHSAFQAITSLRSCHLEGKVTVITVS